MLEELGMPEEDADAEGTGDSGGAGDARGGLGCSKMLGILEILGIIEVLGMLEVARDAEGIGRAPVGAAHTDIWGRDVGCCFLTLHTQELEGGFRNGVGSWELRGT